MRHCGRQQAVRAESSSSSSLFNEGMNSNGNFQVSHASIFFFSLSLLVFLKNEQTGNVRVKVSKEGEEGGKQRVAFGKEKKSEKYEQKKRKEILGAKLNK